MSRYPVFHLTQNPHLAWNIETFPGAYTGNMEIRSFPDGETYVRVNSDVEDRIPIIICTLNHPDSKFLPLYYLARTLKDLNARAIYLVAPYLSYMRQDRRFKAGEGITSVYFAHLLSHFLNGLITIDPHLHRYDSLSEIYSIPTEVGHASQAMAEWLDRNIARPVLIGPDEESDQWVSSIASKSQIPYTVLDKKRTGDFDVNVSGPRLQQYENHTPVLVDDIISTGQTQVETIKQLQKMDLNDPVCLCIHPIFAGEALQRLTDLSPQNIVSCNTISHPTNQIDLSQLLHKQLHQILPEISS